MLCAVLLQKLQIVGTADIIKSTYLIPFKKKERMNHEKS